MELATSTSNVASLKKTFFGSHAGEPVVLRRRKLQRKPPFEALQDQAVEQAFATELLKMLQETEYIAITAVIDKLEHQQKYAAWRYDSLSLLPARNSGALCNVDAPPWVQRRRDG